MQRESRYDNVTFAAAASLSKNVSIAPYVRGAVFIPANWDGGDLLFNVAVAPDTLGGNAVSGYAGATTEAPLQAGSFSRLRQRKADQTYEYVRIVGPTPGEWHELPACLFAFAYFKFESVDPETDAAMTVGAVRTLPVSLKS